MRNFVRLLGMALCLTSLPACVEDYDLDDIEESDVTIHVKELTVPLNLDAITLKSVIDLDEEDVVKVVDGKYAILFQDKFESGAIKVEPFSIPRPSTEPQSATLYPYTVSSSLRDYSVGQPPLVSFLIPEGYSSVKMDCSASGIDSHILAIDSLGISGVFKIDIGFEGIDHLVSDYYIENLRLSLPKGLRIAKQSGIIFDPAKGEVAFPSSIRVNVKEGMEIRLPIEGIDMKTGAAAFENGTFDFKGECSLTAMLGLYQDNLLPGVTPEEASRLRKVLFKFHPYFEDNLVVDSFTGDIDYKIDDLNVSGINIDDIPDALNQAGTSLGLVNPQVYVKMNSPLAQTGVGVDVSIELIPTPHTDERFVCSFTQSDEESALCFSPTRPDSFYSAPGYDYSDARQIEVANLGRILMGERLPERIDVNVEAGTHQKVTDFHLKDYGNVKGEYTFYAPLQLTADSKVIYRDTITGWADEDMDKATISRLSLSADVTKDIPLGVTIEMWPINREGERIGDLVGLASLTKETSEPQPLRMEMDGDITKLDGIILHAKVEAADGETLAPTMRLNVSNLRVTVSAKYVDEL